MFFWLFLSACISLISYLILILIPYILIPLFVFVSLFIYISPSLPTCLSPIPEHCCRHASLSQEKWAGQEELLLAPKLEPEPEQLSGVRTHPCCGSGRPFLGIPGNVQSCRS